MKSSIVTAIIFAAALLSCTTRSSAQLVYNENFGAPGPYPSLSLPNGWAQGKWGAGTDSDNYFERVSIGTLPAIGPRSAPAMLSYRSSLTTSGEASFVASKMLDMRNIPAGGAPFSFWMYRNGQATTANDRIQVYVNSSPNATGATLLNEQVSASNVINRYCSFTPNASPCNLWYQYSYLVPASFNTSSVYIIIVATSAAGNDIYIDDLSITSYPLAQTFSVGNAAAVNQNTATTAKGAANQQIIGCKITTSGALSPLAVTGMLFNTNGSTNPVTDITNAELWFTGGTNAFDQSTATNLGAVANPHATNFTFSGSWSILEHGDNYFWLTYDINNNATSGNFVDAEWLSVTIGGSPVVPAPQTLAGSREIDLVYCIPFYWIGTAWLNYQFNDYINNVTLVGDNVPVPGIGNSLNWITSPAGPNCPSPVPRTCPFQSHPPDYELFPAVPGKTTSLTANGTTNYPISLQVGTFGFGNTIAAWIDFNRDGIFQGSEKIAQSGLMGSLGTYNTTFIVPVNAIAGKTRMRVKESWINLNMSACSNGIFGETEDYVITIVPDCPGATGWTTWLGFTDDWTDPSNWCPSDPPIPPYPLANVRIPGGPSSAGYDYIRPVIRSGVTAQALQLNIEQNDTIFIDAPGGSSLTVNEELRIVGSQSALVVNSQLDGIANVLNGTLTQPTININNSPFSNIHKARSFYMYTQAELIGQGLQAGDIITELRINIERKSTNPVYSNFVVKYYYTNSPLTASSTVPPVFGPSAVTVYSTPSLSVASIPMNTVGTITIPLSTPIVWSGSLNKLVLDVSYNNMVSGLTGANDQPRFTQTTGFRQYLVLANFGPPSANYAAADFLPQAAVNTIVGAGVSSPVNVTSTSMLAVGMNCTGAGFAAGSYISAILNATQISISAPTTAAINGSRTYGTNVFTFSGQQEYRPNVTFKYYRPYALYPITVGKNWINNGNFFPGVSRVTFNGTLLQSITGTDSTTFYDLTINNNAHVSLTADAGVTNNLLLQNGRLKLNNRLLTVTNPLPSAITRVSGYIQSDQDIIGNNIAPFGRLKWNMGSAPGIRVIPFANAANAPVSLSYSVLAGSHDVTFATYRTTPTNLNLPGPTVTNIYGFNGTGWNSDGSALADRFYMISNTGTNPTATITFRYANAERSQVNSTGAGLMSAQRWLDAGGLWEFPFQPGQSYLQGSPDQVTLPSFSDFSAGSWWVIGGNTTPLPISLLDFTATPYKDKVKLHWATASEINNSHFEIQRTVDQNDFSFIGRSDSRGPSNNTQEYELWDLNPLEGIQYYYLHQYDFDGKTEKFGPVTATFSRDRFEILSTTTAEQSIGVTVVFHYNSSKAYNYAVIDVTGRSVASGKNAGATPGVNVLDIPTAMSKGVYQVIIQNEEKVVARKFYY